MNILSELLSLKRRIFEMKMNCDLEDSVFGGIQGFRVASEFSQ